MITSIVFRNLSTKLGGCEEEEMVMGERSSEVGVSGGVRLFGGWGEFGRVGRERYVVERSREGEEEKVPRG